MTGIHTKESTLAKCMVAEASPAQREALLAWAIELTEIRNSPIAALSKARLAIKATAKRTVLAPIMKANLKRTKEVVWSERGWPARFALIGLTIGTLGFSGQAAGLAAFGRAIAVPIWLVLAAGGTLLGTLVQELKRVHGRSVPVTTYTVIEAHEDTKT